MRHHVDLGRAGHLEALAEILVALLDASCYVLEALVNPTPDDVAFGIHLDVAKKTIQDINQESGFLIQKGNRARQPEQSFEIIDGFARDVEHSAMPSIRVLTE